MQSTDVISMGLPAPALAVEPDGEKNSLVASGIGLGSASPGPLRFPAAWSAFASGCATVARCEPACYSAG